MLRLAAAAAAVLSLSPVIVSSPVGPAAQASSASTDAVRVNAATAEFLERTLRPKT